MSDLPNLAGYTYVLSHCALHEYKLLAYLAFKCLEIGPENGLKFHIDPKGDGDFYFKGRISINISINPKSINSCVTCDLYKPWTCICHPLTSNGVLAHPECS